MGWRRRERNYIMPCRRRTSETGRVVTLPSWLLRYLIILKINTSPEATRSLCKEARNSEPTWGFSRIYSCRSRSVETHLLKTFRQQLELSTFNIGFIPFDHCGLFFSILKFSTQSTAAVWHHRESAHNVGIESTADESLCCDDFILFVFQNLILSCLIAIAFVKH